jgi:hypothetical protein
MSYVIVEGDLQSMYKSCRRLKELIGIDLSRRFPQTFMLLQTLTKSLPGVIQIFFF